MKISINVAVPNPKPSYPYIAREFVGQRRLVLVGKFSTIVLEGGITPGDGWSGGAGNCEYLFEPLGDRVTMENS